MATKQRQNWVAGIYKPDAAIARLWNALSTGTRRDKKTLSDSLRVKNPGNRWYWIKRDGGRHKKNQTHSWTIHEENGSVQMRDLKPV